MLSKGRDNFAPKPQNEDEIVSEKAVQEFAKTEKDLKHGQPMHVLFGHGATQKDFEKWDFGTCHDLFYEKRMKTETLINPHFYHDEKKEINKDFINTKLEDLASYGK